MMNERAMVRWRLSTVLVMVGGFSLAMGCGRSGANAPAITDPKVLFEMNCAKCHAQAGEPGGPRLGSSKGPNLTHIGSEPGHTVAWIESYIRDPKSQSSDARMPRFAGVIKDEEIHTLAEFLAARK